MAASVRLCLRDVGDRPALDRKARGEQAVLRNLANAAKLFDGNPSLLQARLIQTLAQGGNTVVFGNEGIQITRRK